MGYLQIAPLSKKKTPLPRCPRIGDYHGSADRQVGDFNALIPAQKIRAV
jgi:hypothetical protein